MRNPNSSISFATAFKHTKTGNDERGRLSSLAFGFATKDFPQNSPRVRGWQTCWPKDTHMVAPFSSTWIPYQLLKWDTEHVNTQMSSVILTYAEMSQRGFFPPLHWWVSLKMFHIYTIWRTRFRPRFILKPDLWHPLADRKGAVSRKELWHYREECSTQIYKNWITVHSL